MFSFQSISIVLSSAMNDAMLAAVYCLLYGIDITLDDSSLCPKVLEVQWSPDCAKACELVPSFWSDGIMGCM
jgi:hypothetical protein